MPRQGCAANQQAGWQANGAVTSSSRAGAQRGPSEGPAGPAVEIPDPHSTQLRCGSRRGGAWPNAAGRMSRPHAARENTSHHATIKILTKKRKSKRFPTSTWVVLSASWRKECFFLSSASVGPRLCATRGGHRPLSRRPRTRSRRREAGQSKRWCKPERLLSAPRLAAIGCHCARRGQTFSSVVTEGRRRGRRPHPQRAAAAAGGHEQHVGGGVAALLRQK